ncbi:MAG TPA: S46 family peptidase [Polyangiaceae bacterium]
MKTPTLASTSLVSLVLAATAAACGGEAQTAQPAAPTTATAVPAATATPAAPPDPFLAYRLQYRDPGGMWMPSQMTLPQHTDVFSKMGVKLDPKTLADPLQSPLASVVFLGGCTGSFVSPQGLVVTNHHCVQGALQLNSKDGKNYVENGFLAKTMAEEPTAGPAQKVMVAQAYTDVTSQMRDGLDAIKDPVARKLEGEKRQKQLIAACEKDRPGIRCQVSSFFQGGLYQLIEMLEIRDVRLVYAPARSVGDYGGEIDNWEWPRHTGDWSFYRAYVGKDGKPADYSPDNVPYQPKHWLKVSTSGLKPGDFVMVAGYPYTTNRNVTARELHNDIEVFYPYLIQYYEDRYKIAEAHLNDAGETSIKATVLKQGVQNGLEKFQGILQGMQKNPDLMAQKDALEKKAKDWAAQPGHEQYAKGIEKLDAIVADEERTQRADFDRTFAFSRGSSLLASALSYTRWAEERAKKDADRKPGYQDRDMPRAQAAQKQMTRQYDRTLDRATFRLALVRGALLPEKDRPWLATLLGMPKGAKIDEAAIDKKLDAWYAATKLEDETTRLDLLTNGSSAKLAASKDPFVQAAQRVWPTYKAEEKKEDARKGDLLLVEPLYTEALKQALGGALAPDANMTLRITYGTVKSLHPESTTLTDGPFTVASQILTKDTGKDPFNAPQKLLDAIKARNFGPYADPALGGDLPIDFESDLDITGGNSGSPTMDDQGRLVGLAFDGNKEGLASDAVFDGTTTRTIQVDARYMLWTMDALDGADNLVQEMGVTSKM